MDIEFSTLIYHIHVQGAAVVVVVIVGVVVGIVLRHANAVSNMMKQALSLASNRIVGWGQRLARFESENRGP